MARVLVVDDSRAVLQLCAAILEAAGHDVVLATGTGEALAAWSTESPDAEPPDSALVDIMLGDGDNGLVLLTQLVAARPDACVAMLTANKEPHVVREALRRGAKDYVVKPFTSHRLLDAVARLAAPKP